METTKLKELIRDEDWNSVKAAIDAGFDINQNDEYDAPIMLRFGDAPVDIVKLCLEKGAKLSSWIIYRFVHSENIDVLEYLIKSGQNLNLPVEIKEDFNGLSGDLLELVPFQALSSIYDEEDPEVTFKIAKLLLDAGLDINATDSTGRTALFSAAISNKIEVIKFLLENGADKKIKDTEGKRAFHCADKSYKEAKALIK